ncbi:RHS repeat domain-containing protein [Pseudomonas cichorii]|uniref:RHS repeat domain-containing protein n=1 Tax=Pseudomonas cichorii TaxID=36746 RepID=UPI001C8ABD8D|nr:RHS repeat-associated core domain-containing protein [Pseudomonas cichorii]MBX8498152.1 RHS repeat protein [Pseudomonas cichorii]
MDWQFANLHRYTPTLAIVDPRRLVVRSVAWYRKQANDAPVVRIHRSLFDPAGRPIGSHDPRLWEGDAPANLVNIHSLSAQVLFCESVDPGWRVSLPGEHRESVQTWDGRGTVRRLEHDGLLRPTGVFENDQCIERLAYGEVDSAPRNQCGQLIRHDDPAGTCLNTECALTGAVIEQTQHFLKDLTQLDWPESEVERDALLETGSGATTSRAYNPLGEVIGQTDAQGNVQRFAQTVAGELQSCHLQLNGQPEQMLVSDIRYDAQGRVESETAGNGVITTASYGNEDGRLLELKAARNAGESLQDLIYDYDPVGNVIRIEDRAQPIRYFANQRIEPVSVYQYDTLYQLTEATGRELAPANHGPVFADFQSPPDPTQLANYTQTYDYDAGGNLQQLTHVGSQNHSRTLVTASHSNRSLPVVNNQPPSEEEIAAAFDANGNLLALQAGQTLNWDLRNQLQEVKPVVRESGLDDSERYIYDASGQRLRKVRTTQAKAVTHLAEVRYLPGLEIRTDTATGETLQVITAQAGRNGVRVLHWQAGKPAELTKDQYRYSLNDHLGSSTLELDKDAQIISQESYYPFGGTSWWAGRNAIEAKYKAVRYSGKERDATGLYHYGLRYYAPWLQRWVNPDPAGAVDGLNLFCFVRNNPCSGFDIGGTVYRGFNDFVEAYVEEESDIIYRGVKDMQGRDEYPFMFALDVAIDESVFAMMSEVARLKEGNVSPLLKFMASTFAEDSNESKKLVANVISGYQILSSGMSRYQKGGELRDQLVVVEGSSDNSTTALVIDPDPHERIFLTERFRRMNVVSKVHILIHELSHNVLKTSDDFYYEGFNIHSVLSPELATQRLESSVVAAIRKNTEMREKHSVQEKGGKIFETWLTEQADFWSTYVLAQITPQQSMTLHQLSIDRFNPMERRGSISNRRQQMSRNVT